MPELPEVETLCRQLKQTILGAVIEELVILDNKLGHPEYVAGLCVRSVERQGKFLLIRLDKGPTLHLHLRMSGRLLWHSHADGLPAHSRFMIRFPHGRLICIDPRRFATLALDDPKDRTAPVPDPLKALNASKLCKAAQGRQAPVKSFLLNQAVVAGIGNIYACEMLHKAAVSPRRRAGSLSPAEWRKVAQAGRNILRKATACRGTSISDWRDLYGEKGEYQHRLAVYGREGLECTRCGEKIQRTAIGGRGTWYCAACQQ
ncbi:MAG: DNA-formamidopyrimidine glycosylase [Deltaproteobacteria bacterium HGW-Deltaproteobacteria-11]|nr:MAG: DNA-formamidopyrimidine glycosylase [Deltaproteobacteria bacterium HGW-Deltaproteobacteria-11]